MKKTIFELLNRLGIPCHILGRKYIEEAVLRVRENGCMGITKDLYPQIADVFQTKPANVERAIRHAIYLSSQTADPSAYEEIFGNTWNRTTANITNGAFIYGLARYINVEENT